jgi:hypothetical protein
MRKIGAVLLVAFLFTGLVACSASVKEREKEALSATGGDRLNSSERVYGEVYVHVVCKDNVTTLVFTNIGFFGGLSVWKKMILDPNENPCIRK